MSEEVKPKNWLDILNVLTKLFATIIIPLVIFFVSQSYTKAQVDNQVSSDYIKMGVGLLSTKPTDDNVALRLWAIELINEYSTIKFTPEAKKELENNSVLLSIIGEIREIEKPIKFSWEDDGSAGYEIEVQKYIDSRWQPHNGLCLSNTSIVMSVPINNEIRWRHGSTKDGKTVFSEWKADPTKP